MRRQPRLDAPGALHYVMGRGIEKTKIFREDEDRADFVQRLAALSGKGALHVYAWALMPNHFHILIRETCMVSVRFFPIEEAKNKLNSME